MSWKLFLLFTFSEEIEENHCYCFILILYLLSTLYISPLFTLGTYLLDQLDLNKPWLYIYLHICLFQISLFICIYLHFLIMTFLLFEVFHQHFLWYSSTCNKFSVSVWETLLFLLPLWITFMLWIKFRITRVFITLKMPLYYIQFFAVYYDVSHNFMFLLLCFFSLCLHIFLVFDF